MAAVKNLTVVTKNAKKIFLGYNIEKIKTWRPFKLFRVFPKKIWWSYDKNCGLLIFFRSDHSDFYNKAKSQWFEPRNFYLFSELWSKVLTFDHPSTKNICPNHILKVLGMLLGCQTLFLSKNESRSTSRNQNIHGYRRHSSKSALDKPQ